MKNWKNWIIFKPIVDVYNSFFNNDKGISYRKAFAAFSAITAYKLSFSIKDEHVKEYIIYAWQFVALFCIGLVTIPDLIKFLNKEKST